MAGERDVPSGMVAALGRVLAGPWPIYPTAIAALVVYGLVIRAVVRSLSQGLEGRPWVELMLPNLVTVVIVAAVAWGGAKGLAHLFVRSTPVPGRPSGRVRYAAIMLLESLVITVTLVLMVRGVLPDGHSPVQPGVIPVAILTALLVIITVVFANGVTGFVLERFRREEELVRGERTMQLAAEERVRAETARYLHDDVQTALLRASLRLVPLVERTADGSDQEALRVAITEIDAVRSEGVRAIGRRLAPPLASTGLIVALNELAASFDGVARVEVHFDDAAAGCFRIVADGDRSALAVYRIAEQALQNALKHGRASAVRVAVSLLDSGQTRVLVEADGLAPTIKAVPGDGTAIINAWLDDVGGNWALGAGKGGGSCFRAVIGRPDAAYAGSE